MAGVFGAIARREATRPKTVLGFFGGILVALYSVSGLAFLALPKSGVGLAVTVGVAAVDAVAFFAVLAFVMWLTAKDPSKLMLAQVRDSQYLRIQQMMLGDSLSGERPAIETSPGDFLPLAPPNKDRALLGTDAEEELQS